jgi:acetyl esterase/lipase
VPDDSILTLPPPPATERIAYGPDPNQFGDLRLPTTKRAFPIAINIHGGFWRARYDLSHAGHLCAALTKKGLATWNLEYRRVGNQGGGWPGTFEDLLLGGKFLESIAWKYHLDLKRMVVLGHSAGGQLALCLASRLKGFRGVVSLAGVCDLRRGWELKLSDNAIGEFLDGSPAQVPEHYREASPIEIPVAISQRILHGRDDDVVPLELSRSYAERKSKQGERLQLQEIAQAGHFELIDPRSKAWEIVEKSVLALLGA